MTKPDALIERAVDKAATELVPLCNDRYAHDVYSLSALLSEDREKVVAVSRAAIVAFLREIDMGVMITNCTLDLRDLKRLADLVERGGG